MEDRVDGLIASTSQLKPSRKPAPGRRKLPLGWDTGHGWPSEDGFFGEGGSQVSRKGKTAVGGLMSSVNGKGTERRMDPVGLEGPPSPDARPPKRPRYFDASVVRLSESSSIAQRKSSTSSSRPKFLSNRQLLPPQRPPSPPARLKPVPQIGSHDTVLAAKPVRHPTPLDLLFGGSDPSLAPSGWSSHSSSFYSPKPEVSPSVSSHRNALPAAQKALFTKVPPPHKAKLFLPQIRHPPRPKPSHQSTPFKPLETVNADSKKETEAAPKDDLFEGDDSMSDGTEANQVDRGKNEVVNRRERGHAASPEERKASDRGTHAQAVEEPKDAHEGSPELFEGVSVSPPKPVLSLQAYRPDATRSASIAGSCCLTIASRHRHTFSRLSRSLSRHTPVYYSDESDGEVVLAPARRPTVSARSTSPDLAAPPVVRKESHKVEIEPTKVKKVENGDKEKAVRKDMKPQPRPPVKVRTEDDWWNIDPDEQLRHVEPPEGWLPAPETSKETGQDKSRILELTLHKVAVPASDVVASTFEDGEWFVGLKVTLVAVKGNAAIVLSGHETELHLLLLPSPPSQPLSHTRIFVPDIGTVFAFSLDSSLAATASDIQLRLMFIDGSTHLPITMSLTRTPTAFAPRHVAFSSTEAGLALSLNVLSAKPPVTPQSAQSTITQRLERIAIDQSEPDGMWIPDPMAVRGHEVADFLPMINGRMGYNFATKLPFASGDRVEVFGDNTLEHMRPFIRAKDDEISRSTSSPESKIVARAQMRWCLLNPYPPSVFKRELACWRYYAPLVHHFQLRFNLSLFLASYFLRHRLITETQLREILHAYDSEVSRIERGKRIGYEEWKRRIAWLKERGKDG